MSKSLPTALFSLAMLAAVSLVGTTYGQSSLTKRLVAYYPYNNSLENVVAGGTPAAGTNLTFTADRNGNTNGAINLDGASSYLEGINLNSGEYAWTFSTLAYLNTSQQLASMFCIGSSAWAGIGFVIQDAVNPSATNRGNNALLVLGGIQVNAISNVQYETNRWHLLTVVKDGNTLTLYKDRTPVFTTNQSHNPLAGSIFVGSNPDFVQRYNSSFQGKLDETKLWLRGLSQAGIDSLYAETFAPTVANRPSLTGKEFAIQLAQGSQAGSLTLLAQTSLANSQVTVRDVQGRTIHKAQVEGETNQFTLTGLPPGFYAITLNNNCLNWQGRTTVR